ncbi:lysozyme inhibitor LprI family protein [Methylocystis parvus]|uniref:lysozyme inhibitor LprI family protein n=1 Tax=Methylocystis parvus TaxID=134 RepID=UPI003C78DB93
MRAPLMLVVCLVAAPAVAAEKDCSEMRTQIEINECEHKKFKKADAALNAAYAKLAAKVSTEGKAKLVEAQRAWIKYRDTQCEFETFGTINGSIHPLEVAQCEAELTMAQTKRLDGQLNCEEGDPSCGGQ